MGFFGKLIGSVDQDLLANGIPGRGEITAFAATGMTLSIGNGLTERNCNFTVKVQLDNTPAYDAAVTQRIQEVYIPQIQSGTYGPVAVRVDPKDHSRVAIAFGQPVPEVTLPQGVGHNSAADILANGKPIAVVFVGSAPTGMKNAAGDEVYALTLTVAEGVDTPYQIQVGNAVPASALPLCFPGNRLHARLGDGPNDVVVDWAAGAVKA